MCQIYFQSNLNLFSAGSSRIDVDTGQDNLVNNKVSSSADMPSCVSFVLSKGIIGVYCHLGKTK